MKKPIFFLILISLLVIGCTRSNITDDISAPPTVVLGTSMLTLEGPASTNDKTIGKDATTSPGKPTSTRTLADRGTTPSKSETPTKSSSLTAITRTGRPPPTPTTKLPGGVPVKLWKDIPIMPEAVTGEENEDRYRFVLEATVDQVEDFYKAELPKLGWKFDTKGTGENGAPIFIFSKNGKILSISVIVIGDIVVVSLAPI
jgi:hypothetical protein